MPTVSDGAYLVGTAANDMAIEIMSNEALKWSVLCGYFDVRGKIVSANECYIVSGSHSEAISKACSCIPHNVIGDRVVFYGTNAIDFLGKIYSSVPASVSDDGNREEYLNIIGGMPPCHVYRASPDAVLPSKNKASDVGYDLTVIKKTTHFNDITALYDTGLKVMVAPGMYAEVVPRSSLSKSGYMLANSIGIIDPSYTGNIMVALTKVNPDAPDLELPFRCCQLIFRRQEHVDVIEKDQPFDSTTRNEGGFGSTGI